MVCALNARCLRLRRRCNGREIKPVVEEEDGDERQDLLADFGVMRFPLQESGVDPRCAKESNEVFDSRKLL